MDEKQTSMEVQQVKKVVVIGPESTGKSTLCEQLAKQYNTVWCPEYAREYLQKYGTDYSFEDLKTIAKGQLALEEEYVSKVNGEWSIVNGPQSTAHGQLSINSRLLTPDSRCLFIDTDMYVMKVWCEYVFGKCHQLILDEIATRKYDLYLLCNIDLPWAYDPLREYPDEQPRQELYRIYKDLLVNQNVPWVEISGDYEERLQIAIDAVDGVL